MLLAACNPTTVISGSGSGDRPDPARFLHADPATRSAILTLVAGYPATDSQFNFNGYANGTLEVTIPVGWAVTVQCANRGTVPNSCTVVDPARPDRPADPAWTTPDPGTGLAPGGSATFTFIPDRPASLRLVSLPTGRAASGTWAALVVSASGGPGIRVR